MDRILVLSRHDDQLLGRCRTTNQHVPDTDTTTSRHLSLSLDIMKHCDNQNDVLANNQRKGTRLPYQFTLVKYDVCLYHTINLCAQ